MQRNRDKSGLLELGRDTRRNGMSSEDRDALLDAKDWIIAELKEQVAFLRRELERKDAVLLRMAESSGGLLSTPASEATGNPRASYTREGWEEPVRPTLPDGYRVVAFASDAWVLIAPRGLRVAAYRGELDLGKVAIDAREHHRRGEE